MTEQLEPAEHERLGVLAGAFVVGALAPDERSEFTAHLARCAICQDEVTASAAVPGALRAVHPAEAAALDHPDELALRRLLAAASREWTARPQSPAATPPRQRGWWWLRASAALVAAAAAGALLTVLGFGLFTGPGVATAMPMRTVAPATITGTAGLVEQPWGVDLELRCRDDGGALAGQRLTLVTIDTSGRRTAAATWTAVTSTNVVIRASTALPRSAIAQLTVESPDGRPLLELSPT